MRVFSVKVSFNFQNIVNKLVEKRYRIQDVEQDRERKSKRTYFREHESMMKSQSIAVKYQQNIGI